MSIFMLRASTALAGVVFAASAAHPALAADLTVTGTRTDPVVTSNASSGPGNVIVDGVLEVASGTAITVDSNNSVTVNTGKTVRSKALSNGVGLVVATPVGGLSGTITNNGQIAVTGTGTNNAVGTNNVGLLIGGAGSFTGNVVSGNAGSIVVGGDDSFGVSVTSRLIGTLGLRNVSAEGARSTAVSITGQVDGAVDLRGAVTATGDQGIGLAVRGTVNGMIANGGSIVTGQAETTKDNVVTPAVKGTASVLVAGSVTGGFLNDRFYIDANGARVAPADVDTAKHTLVVGKIVAVGGAPAILVSPGAAATQNASIGNVGTGEDAYGVVNRGEIQAGGGTAGRAVDTVLVVGGNGFQALTGGGFHNRTTGLLSAVTTNAAASGIRVGAGGVVPEIRNAGRIEVRTDRTGGDTPGVGGTAYGIRIDAGSDVDRIVNSGTIQSTANGNNQTAYGIFDAAGLESITNSGTIRTFASEGANIATVAIDASLAASPLQLTNSGHILGDIRFGSGSDVFTITAGTVTGNLSFGAGANQLNLSGGTVTGAFSANGGTIAATLSGDGKLDLTGQSGASFSSLSATGTSRIVLDVGAGFTGLQVSGAAGFTGSSTIEINVRDLLAGTQTIDLVTAAGGFTTDHASSIVDTASSPFIYAVDDVVVDGTGVSITLRRKSATELGLSAAYGEVFDASIAALASEQGLTSAVNTLRDQASFAAAVRELTPTTFGTGALRTLIANQDAGFGMLSHRLEGVRRSFGGAAEADDKPRFGLWAQQTGQFFNRKDRADDPGFDGNAYGIAGGGDLLLGENAAIGVGIGYVSSKVDPDGLSGKPLIVDNLQADIYGTAKLGGLFVDASIGYGTNDYNSKRNITFGGLERTATAKFSGSQIAGNLTVGYDFRVGKLHLVPSNSISYLRVKQDGYTETGAGALDLEVEGDSVNIVRNTAKLALGYGVRMGDGELRIDARGGWVSRISGDGFATVGRFVGGTTSFELDAASAADDGWRAGGGISYIGSNSSLALNFDRESASGFTNNGISFTLAMHF